MWCIFVSSQENIESHKSKKLIARLVFMCRLYKEDKKTTMIP